jgi:predicted AAA+ superfamily ATPase
LQITATAQVIVFDEIHKLHSWHNLLKGYFDILRRSHRFLVTGSARLDYYKRGGDSLLGRYCMHLRFIREKTGREVDFVVLEDRRPLFAVECKLNDTNLSPYVHYLTVRMKGLKFYQLHMGNTSRQISDQVSIMPFLDFCKILNLP